MVASRRSDLVKGVAAVALLLLMLSSQIAGTAASARPSLQLPNPPAPSSPPPVQPPSQQSPGQLSYTNTWNRTQPTVCVQASAAAAGQDPLKQQNGQSWTIASSVPSVVAANSVPSGQPVRYTYTAFSNGTFLASDDQGNSLSWKGVSGFPPGPTTIRLFGNSTEALQLYTVGTSGHTTANFTVAYHLMQTANGCEPHGVRVTIQGFVNWPGPGGGTLQIAFQGQPLSANSTQLAFGGRNGMKLVFDWSDNVAKAIPASYQTQTATVSWSVSGTFKIAPSIVGTSTSQLALNWGNQRKLWHTVESNGTTEYWAFYFDGTNIEKAWSLTGVKWHSSYLTTTQSGVLTSGAAFSSWMYSGNGVYTLYYALADAYGGGGFLLGVAHLGDNGAVNNDVEKFYYTIWGAGDSYPCVYATPTDVIVGLATSSSGAYQLEVYHIGASSKQVLSKTAVSTGTVPDGCIALGLSSGYALVYGAATTASPAMMITSADGNNWSVPTTSPTTSPITMSSAVAIGNTVDFATITSSGEAYWSCAYPCKTTNPVLTLVANSAGVTYDNIVLSTNTRSSGASITATYHTISGLVWSRTSDDDGQTWTPPQEVSDGSTGMITSGSLQADYDYVQGVGQVPITITDVAWVTSGTMPYVILFPAYPVVVPSAASTPDPWAKSGYSPYESYFSQLNEYVSPGSGLLGVSQTDLAIPGRAPALSLTRVFTTPSDFTGATNARTPYGYDNYTLSSLGIGWELGYPWIGGSGYFHPGNGASIPLAFNGSNIMEYHGAINFVLYRNSNNDTYTLFTADGTKYVYAGLRLSTITSPDSASNKLTFSYNVNPGYITQIQDSEGRKVSFSYNSNNTLASIASGTQTWRYTYKGSDLSSVTDPLGRVTRYYYASFNPWLISEIAYPTGAATYYVYDVGLVAPDVSTYAVYRQSEYSSGSALVLARSNTYDFTMVDGSMISSQVVYQNATSAQQGSTVFDFRQISGKFVELQYQKDAAGNLIGEVETDFDSHGRANQTTLFSAQGARLAYSVAHHDEWGNVNFTQDFNGHDAYLAYAGTKDQYQFGNGKTGLIQNFYTNSTIDRHIHTDLLGSAEFQDIGNSNTPIDAFYLYSNNEVIRTAQLYSPTPEVNTWLTTSYTYDALANLQTMTDPLRHQTCYSYSSTYNGAYVTSETSSGSSNCYTGPNVSVAFTYNFATGQTTSQTDAEGNTTAYAYDAIGRLTKTSYPAVNGVIATTSYSYDDSKNVVTALDARGNVTKSYYDGLGRLTQQQAYLSPSGSPYSLEFYTYNWLNQVVTDQKPNGATYRYDYDSLGRSTGVTNPDGSHESATYDQTTNTETITDGNGHQTQNVYDFMQQLVAVREYWSAGGYNATTYTHDGVGNLVRTAGPDANQITQYSHDDLNRPVKTIYSDGTTQKSSYDVVGNLVSTTDGERRVTTYSYDFLYRLSTVNHPDGSSTTYTYDKNGNVLTVTNSVDQIKYSYDALNRMLSETDVIGGTQYRLSYTYNLAGNVQSVTYPDRSTVTNSYDALDRLTKVAGGPMTYASFAYNPDGTISTMTYGNGEVTSYSYDSLSRPTSITTTQGPKLELSLSYKYDKVGNVVSVNSESYRYDALNRLASATGPWGTTTYSYDAAGNMAQKQNSSSTVRYVYTYMDELVKSSTAGIGATYSYDGNGDLVIKNDGNNVWTYVCNTQSQLTKVLEDGVLIQQNFYDGNGRRVEQVTGAGTTLYLYAGLNVLYEKNLQTGVSTKHVYADGMQVASVTSSGTFFLHQDELGSTRLVTNGNSPVFSSDYVPYGVQYGATGSQEFKYTGMVYDAATGLYYDNARFYDPSTGKFLTQDPTGGSQSDPQSLNGYAYARDNPLAITDPSGLSWNPLTWSPTTWLLLGAAIGLTIVSAAQFGLDPVTDALDAGAISEFIGSAVAIGASSVGLPVVTLGTEDPDFGLVDQFIGSLTAEQLDGFLRDERNIAYRTDIVQSRLAAALGGTSEPERIPTEAGHEWQTNHYRIYDVTTKDERIELKNWLDEVDKMQLEKDVELMDKGENVRYFLVEDPVYGRGPTLDNLYDLEVRGIPYTYLTWNQFLGLM